MKVSELTDTVIRDYIGIGPTEDVSRLKAAAVHFITYHTGMTAAEIDEREDLTEAALALCSHFYDNRDFTATNAFQNRVVYAILNRYRRNLIS